VNFKTHAAGLHYADLNAAFAMLSVVTQSVVMLTVAAAEIRSLPGF